MENRFSRAMFWLGAAAVLGTGCASQSRAQRDVKPPQQQAQAQLQEQQPPQRQSSLPEDLRKVTQNWGEASQKAADDMFLRYGAPRFANENMLVWERNGPWKRTVVHREEVRHNFPVEHVDILEQTIGFRVPADKLDEIAAFDGSLVANRTRGELTALSENEEMNWLALNLASDIVENKRSVDEAREFYANRVAMAMAGRSYLEGPRFQNQGEAGDPDRTVEPRVGEEDR